MFSVSLSLKCIVIISIGFIIFAPEICNATRTRALQIKSSEILDDSSLGIIVGIFALIVIIVSVIVGAAILAPVYVGVGIVAVIVSTIAAGIYNLLFSASSALKELAANSKLKPFYIAVSFIFKIIAKGIRYLRLFLSYAMMVVIGVLTFLVSILPIWKLDALMEVFKYYSGLLLFLWETDHFEEYVTDLDT